MFIHHTASAKISLPRFGELRQTSQDLGDICFETQASWDDCRNSSKSVFSTSLGLYINTCSYITQRVQKIDLPLFGELGQTSQDLADLWSKRQESWDDCRNSSKSVFSPFLGFLPQHMFIHHIASAKISFPLFDELGQTSQDLADICFETQES